MKLYRVVILMAWFALSPLSVNADEHDETGFFGNFRVGVINDEDDAGESSDGSAFGGKLGYVSPSWHWFSAGATVYATQKLFDDEQPDFFASDGKSYAILGEAFLQGDFGNTMVKGGRFEFDSPHLDTDDIRMVPNTFQGGLLTNGDLPGTTLYLAHIDEFAGQGATIPEEFTDINGDDGVSIVGAENESVENLALQAWFYRAEEFADLLYLEAFYETDKFSIGAQFGDQSDDSLDGSGPDGEVYGVAGSVTFADLTLSAAYNDVSGTVTDGFGGGPYFTNADIVTLDFAEDQEAIAVGMEYSGIAGLTLGIFHFDFDVGENETDLAAVYEVNDRFNVELVYADLHDDGHVARIIANLGF